MGRFSIECEPFGVYPVRLIDHTRGGSINVTYPEVQALRDLLNREFPPEPAQEEPTPRPDLAAYIARQREWSRATFGPTGRLLGITDHIRKELVEIERAPQDVREWVDVVILALDGAWRTGAEPEHIVAEMNAKYAENVRRRWPDWRGADPDRAIEHVREQPTPQPDPECVMPGKPGARIVVTSTAPLRAHYDTPDPDEVRRLIARYRLAGSHLAPVFDAAAAWLRDRERRPVMSVRLYNEQPATPTLITVLEQLAAHESSSRNLAHYAFHGEGFDAPMSGVDLVTRDALRDLRGAMEIAFAERAKAQKALIYLAREAGGSPVSEGVELDRHGQEIRAAIVKLHEHAARIATPAQATADDADAQAWMNEPMGRPAQTTWPAPLTIEQVVEAHGDEGWRIEIGKGEFGSEHEHLWIAQVVRGEDSYGPQAMADTPEAAIQALGTAALAKLEADIAAKQAVLDVVRAAGGGS